MSFTIRSEDNVADIVAEHFDDVANFSQVQTGPYTSEAYFIVKNLSNNKVQGLLAENGTSHRYNSFRYSTADKIDITATTNYLPAPYMNAFKGMPTTGLFSVYEATVDYVDADGDGVVDENPFGGEKYSTNTFLNYTAGAYILSLGNTQTLSVSPELDAGVVYQ